MNSRSDPATWRALQAELDVLLPLSAADRAARLAAIGADDVAQGAELASLLAQLDAERIPEALPLTFLTALDTAEDDSGGQRFGHFVVQACIGRGGSGVVYRAYRDGDYAQTVAIKLLNGARIDAAGVRRLQHERDMLARMDHPGIVRLVDSGITDDGRHFLVLEHVDGLTWDRYLIERAPPAPQRLAMFAAVCDAVAYAHQRLLVHRDIKPGNLMVSTDGTPKLLDYGISKLLEEQDDSTLTRDFGSSLTPAYAAPEQLRGEPVTTATDVHALGILLYETLCGAHPYRTDERRGEALRQAIMNESATALIALPNLVAMPAAWRSDLDRIVAMALDKDPQQRYASARELGDDVRAVLAGKPIRARRATAGYLLRRFAGRHRVAMGIVATSLVLLIVTTIAAVWQSRVAASERALAERRFEDVHRFANVMLFDYQEGIRKLAGSLPMQQRLVADALRYLESLRRDASGNQGLLADLVIAYIKVGDLQGNPYGPNIGDLEGAARSYGEAQSLIDTLRITAFDSNAIGAMQARLWSRLAELRHQAGELDAARDIFERSLSAFAALPIEMQKQTDAIIDRGHVLDHYGDLLGRESGASLNHIDAARKAHAEARSLREVALKSHPEHAGLRYGRYQSELRDGEYWIGQNDMKRAQTALLQAFATITSLVATDTEDVFYRYEQALVHSRLVPVQEAMGHLDTSVSSALQALATTETMLARDPGNDMLRQAVSASCGWAAKQLIKAGRTDEAIPVVARQIEVNQLWLATAPDNPEASFALSLAYRRRGELLEARREYTGAVASHRQALNLQAPMVVQSPDFALGHALTQMHIGRNLAAAGAIEDARVSLQAATSAMTQLVAANPGAARYREYLAEAWAQLAEAFWRSPIATDQAARAAQSAIAIWDHFERDGVLALPSAARRETLKAQLALR
ncbi:MAG: serine/threonine-protein kinase [Pseudomonadota bacterium]|nr:serine/threonine-protein kinase [Pseudomonadota bacterium]